MPATFDDEVFDMDVFDGVAQLWHSHVKSVETWTVIPNETAEEQKGPD